MALMDEGVNTTESSSKERPLRILVSGATGLLGRHIVASRRAAGDTVVALARSGGSGESILWQPEDDSILDPASVSGFDVVIHLAGEPVAGRWTEAKKRRILESRARGTTKLATALAGAAVPPAVMICASGMNYYGERGDQIIDESAPEGRQFLSKVCEEWESACLALAGISRIVNLRIGLVLAADGGTLPLMLPIFRFGLGGPVGGGCNYISWVSIDDLVRAVNFTVAHDSLQGPVNLVSPNPVRNDEFTRTLAAAVHRPAFLPVPGWVVRLLFGEFAEETILSSLRAVPKRLLEAGFNFHDDTLPKALAACGLK